MIEAASGSRRVIVIPVGDVAAEMLDWLCQQLGARLGIAVNVGRRFPPRPVATGGGADSDDLLDSLAEWFLAQHDSEFPPMLLGITELPLSAAGRSLLFGQATVGGCCAIVTLEPLGSASDSRRNERLLKECVHELAHVCGLAHCADPACVMFPSADIAATDRKDVGFCPRCAGQAASCFPALDSP